MESKDFKEITEKLIEQSDSEIFLIEEDLPSSIENYSKETNDLLQQILISMQEQNEYIQEQTVYIVELGFLSVFVFLFSLAMYSFLNKALDW